jgi:hypothetical protein
MQPGHSSLAFVCVHSWPIHLLMVGCLEKEEPVRTSVCFVLTQMPGSLTDRFGMLCGERRCCCCRCCLRPLRLLSAAGRAQTLAPAGAGLADTQRFDNDSTPTRHLAVPLEQTAD